ncbi:MAG: hypothetical protein KA792_06025 [Bacteroidales bacterium]|nr:hypothetical protein [Bacteroidales bacterium]
MGIKNNQGKFDELRKSFDYFSFEGFKINFIPQGLQIVFNFNLAGKYIFEPVLLFEQRKFFRDYSSDNIAMLESLAFNIGMIELLSYWKTACPKRIIIKCGELTPKQTYFWKKLYFNGLGEFFYTNNIHTDISDFANFEIENQKHSTFKIQNLTFKNSIENQKHSKFKIQNLTFKNSNAYLVPVGGGKDSIVSIELLKEMGVKAKYMSINADPARNRIFSLLNLNQEDTIEIKRTLSPRLLDLNNAGFLNGHTPFSALIAFVSLMASYLSGFKHIALSNESSANEATVPDTNINHQYSKSFEFENDFRSYANEFISADLNYFSLLRPLNELQIAFLFSKQQKYFHSFRSCNVGSKKDLWCCSCPKCLFTYIILSPFINSNNIINIFGSDLLDKEELLPVFKELTGLSDIKPFECVGTTDEINIALSEIIRQYKNNQLPALLQYYSHTDLYNTYKTKTVEKKLKQFDNNHFISDKFANFLKYKLNE